MNNEQNDNNILTELDIAIQQTWAVNSFTNLELGTYLRENSIPFNQNRLTKLKKMFTMNQLTRWKDNKSLRTKGKKRKKKITSFHKFRYLEIRVMNNIKSGKKLVVILIWLIEF